MKQKIPTLDELIERYVDSIQLRNPNIPISENGRNILKSAWEGKEKLLLRKVKEMEHEEHVFNTQNRRVDTRIVTFCTGVDILGFQTFTTHLVKFENSFKDPKRYKKEGSDFKSKLVASSQVNHIQEGFKSRVIPN